MKLPWGISTRDYSHLYSYPHQVSKVNNLWLNRNKIVSKGSRQIWSVLMEERLAPEGMVTRYDGRTLRTGTDSRNPTV